MESISKNDIMEALAARSIDPYSGTVCGFGVKPLKDAELEADNQGICIMTNDVIYQLLEEYKDYYNKRKSEDTAKAMNELTLPGKMSILPQFIFRRSDPMIVGVHVDGGVILPKLKVINQDGENVGTIHSLKREKDYLQEAHVNDEVAVSITGVVMGRNVKETDVLFIKAPESDIRQLRTTFRDQLSPDTLTVLIEYVKVMREKDNQLWAA